MKYEKYLHEKQIDKRVSHLKLISIHFKTYLIQIKYQFQYRERKLQVVIKSPTKYNN